MANYRVIGKPVERVDGPEMLTGQAVYGPDVNLPGMLWGKILRSPIPHGKVLRVDVEKAKKSSRREGGYCGQRCAVAPLRLRRRRRAYLCDRKGALCRPTGRRRGGGR